MIERHLEIFEDFIENKNLEVEMKSTMRVDIQANPLLFDMVISNLISNAIKHNQSGGYVKIELSQKGLMINNSGHPPIQPTENLFNRFEKSSENADSSGLGLAIVKEICDYHNLEIEYKFEEDHAIAITF